MWVKVPLVVLFVIASANCQKGRIVRQRQAVQQQTYDNFAFSGQYQESQTAAPNSLEEPEGAPEPPALVPQTSFSCEGKPYELGMYADMEVGCSVYHLCYNGRKESFLCGPGTLFNQEILSCDHPQNVNCNSAPRFYSANLELGKPGAEPSSAPAPTPAPAPVQAPVVSQPISKASIVRPQQQPQPQVQQQSWDIFPLAPVSMPAPRPIPRPAPAPLYQPQVVVQQRPSKVSPPKQRVQVIQQQQQPIVQTTQNDGEYSYEPTAQIYYQELAPVRQVQYRSSAAKIQRRRWNQYKS